MAAVVTAAGAGAAAAMYLNAKFHLAKDIATIRRQKSAIADFMKSAQEQRQSPYYRFEEAALRMQDGECIWSRDGCYSWTQALAQVHRYGQWFLSLGVRPHDLVALYLQNSPDVFFAWMGLWSIGAAPALINFNLADKALVHCLSLSTAKLLVADDVADLRARIDAAAARLTTELGMRIVLRDRIVTAHINGLEPTRPSDEWRAPVKGDWPIALFYTSGTTGMPKAVPFHNQRFQISVTLGVTMRGVLSPDDRWYVCMPLYHATGAITSFVNLLNGVTVCIGRKFSTSKFWDDVRDSRATWIVYVGETARYLLNAPPSPRDQDHCVRGMYGNGLRPDVWSRFQDRFGICEVGEFFNSSEGVFTLVNHCRSGWSATAVGHHGALMRLYLRNTLATVSIDQATGAIERDPQTGFAVRNPMDVGGEVIVAVPDEKAFAGYFNNAAATAKKFEHDVFAPGDLWYRSGDALRRTPDGLWLFVDRLGDTFRWKGENVSTAEVADVLGRFAGVREANVYGVQLPNHDGRAGCAALFIDPALRGNFDFAGLLRYSRQHLPRYAVPLFIRVAQEMTHIHNNKQNKVPLRNEGVDLAQVKSGDEIWWLPPGGSAYEPFTADKWSAVQHGRVSL